MVPLMSVAALICVGIGVDFSGQTIAEQELRDQAAHCAREGAARATLGATNTSQAVTIANQCLSTQGLEGTATLEGASLVVEAKGTYTTKLLTIISITQLPLHGTASTQITQSR